jgi:hypothetical protein
MRRGACREWGGWFVAYSEEPYTSMMRATDKALGPFVDVLRQSTMLSGKNASSTHARASRLRQGYQTTLTHQSIQSAPYSATYTQR